MRERRAGPVVAPPAWRTVTRAPSRDAEAQRILAGEHDLVAALEREPLGARDRGAGEQRAAADGAEAVAARRPAAGAEPAREPPPAGGR